MKPYTSSSVLSLVLTETLLVAACVLVAAYAVLPVDPLVFFLYDEGLLRGAIIIGTVLAGFYLQDMYTDLRVLSRTVLLQQTLVALGPVFLVQALISYLSRDLMMPRWMLIFGCGMMFVVLPAWRILYAFFLRSAVYSERVLMVGLGSIARQIDKGLAERPQLGISVVGYVGNCGRGDEPQPPVQVLGELADLLDLVRREKPDRLIIALEGQSGVLPENDLLHLRLSGVRVQRAADLYEEVFNRVYLPDLHPAQLIFSPYLGPRPSLLLIQTVYSRLLAVLLLVLMAPAMALIACLVKLSSQGPVLYRQKRVGMGGRVFTLLKFRSMCDDAEAQVGPVWASKEDARITPVGRWLRLLRLDELPQLVNVLRGEMSLVGPRPERPEFVEVLTEKIPFYPLRLYVRPGITGWAQINHDYADSMEETAVKLEYDLYYVKHVTPALDAYVIFSTLKVILLGKGAR